MNADFSFESFGVSFLGVVVITEFYFAACSLHPQSRYSAKIPI